MDEVRVAAAMRKFAQGFTLLAEAFEDQIEPRFDREEALRADWGDRHLAIPETKELFRRYDIPGAAIGGWIAKGRVLTDEQGLRYLA